MFLKQRSNSADVKKSDSNTEFVTELDKIEFTTPEDKIELLRMHEYSQQQENLLNDLKIESKFKIATLQHELELKEAMKNRLRFGDIKRKDF